MANFDFDVLKGAKGDILEILKPEDYTGEDVKKFREKYHLTQRKLAILMNVTKKSVEKWEQGKNKVSGSAAMLFCIFDANPLLMNDIYNYISEDNASSFEYFGKYNARFRKKGSDLSNVSKYNNEFINDENSLLCNESHMKEETKCPASQYMIS